LPAPVVSGRFVIRATHERGVGVPPSRSLSAASRKATCRVSGRARWPVEQAAPVAIRPGGRRWPAGQCCGGRTIH